MERVVREWALPAAAGILGSLALVLLLREFPRPWPLVAWMLAIILPSITIWILSGGTVASIGAWLVPTVILAVAVLLAPSEFGLLILGVAMGLPCIGGVFAPIGRAFGWYTARASGWIVIRSLPHADRSATDDLRRALVPDSGTSADIGQTADISRTIRGLRTHASNIRNLRTPDLGWAKLVRTYGAAIDLYADVLEGRRPPEYEAATSALDEAREEWRDLLRSRSAAYRILTHQFVGEKNAASASVS